MTAPPRRILIVRLSHLGDVLHALPLFHALRRRHPGARIAWAVQPEHADLLEGLPGLTRLVRFERRGGWRAWPRLWRELADYRPDWTLDAQGNLKSAAVTRLSRAPRRTGWDPADWREPAGAWAVRDRAPALGPGPHHAVDRALHLAAHAVGESPEEVRAALPPDWLGLEEARRSAGRRLWVERMGTGEAPRVVVQLAAPGDVRAWPVRHQLALLRGLAAAGCEVLALSGPAEEELGARVRAELADEPRVRHWVGQRGLRRLAAFLRAGAEAGARFVGGDSGPTHLAWVAGLPVVGLAGPQDERRTGPWPPPGPGSPHRVVRAEQSPDCAPCLSRSCALPEGPLCMERLEPADVLAALGLA